MSLSDSEKARAFEMISSRLYDMRKVNNIEGIENLLTKLSEYQRLSQSSIPKMSKKDRVYVLRNALDKIYFNY